VALANDERRGSPTMAVHRAQTAQLVARGVGSSVSALT
jgi:hypothetical protein